MRLDHSETSPHTHSDGQDQRQREQQGLARLWRNRSLCGWGCERAWHVLRRVSTELSASPLLRDYSEESTGLHQCLHTHAHSSVTHSSHKWKQPKRPWLGKSIDKLWSIHTMEQDRAIIRNEVLTPAPTWRNLDDVMPSQTRLSQKGGYHTVTQLHANEVPRVVSFMETESRRVWVAGGGDEGLVLKGAELLEMPRSFGCRWW